MIINFNINNDYKSLKGFYETISSINKFKCMAYMIEIFSNGTQNITN